MLNQTADLLESEGGELYEGYSGRGMYGKETTAVTFDSESDAREAMLQVAYYAGGEAGEDPTAEEVLEDLKKARFDSLGLGVVVY